MTALGQLLAPARQPGESFRAYRGRRAQGNRLVKRLLRGSLSHVSTSVGFIPDAQWTAQHATAVERGHLIVVSMGIDRGAPGRWMRTRGTTYRKPKEERK